MRTAMVKSIMGIIIMMMLAGCAQEEAKAVLLEASPSLEEQKAQQQQQPVEVICKCECSCPQSEQTAQKETSSENEKVNINTADALQLQTLTGIGQTRAQEIISYRQTYGPFQSIEDIQHVNGIKRGVYEKIKDDISVG